MNPNAGNLLANVLVAALIVAAVYFGREVLLPIALAVLLSFVLAPPVRLLQRLNLPRFSRGYHCRIACIRCDLRSRDLDVCPSKSIGVPIDAERENRDVARHRDRQRDA